MPGIQQSEDSAQFAKGKGNIIIEETASIREALATPPEPTPSSPVPKFELKVPKLPEADASPALPPSNNSDEQSSTQLEEMAKVSLASSSASSPASPEGSSKTLSNPITPELSSNHSEYTPGKDSKIDKENDEKDDDEDGGGDDEEDSESEEDLSQIFYVKFPPKKYKKPIKPKCSKSDKQQLEKKSFKPKHSNFIKRLATQISKDETGGGCCYC